MNLFWTDIAWEDYLYWQGMDKKTLRRVNALLKDMMRHPFDGIGKPEPLRHEFAGYWSRRIDAANRIVYSVEDDVLKIYQCRTHYGDK